MTTRIFSPWKFNTRILKIPFKKTCGGHPGREKALNGRGIIQRNQNQIVNSRGEETNKMLVALYTE